MWRFIFFTKAEIIRRTVYNIDSLYLKWKFFFDGKVVREYPVPPRNRLETNQEENTVGKLVKFRELHLQPCQALCRPLSHRDAFSLNELQRE
ncbi:hypothetical protein SAMN05216244_2706 [Sediminibacillus halophilus]|uniref:Uncharacterized protein n=1 Tax=Sediminibacillus halophilus TaxID=482461 RepID=A0A1G9TS23_9BACI|nr:hypothetical protein SAMN05216244_2706 [Sediminibacillus halophilus]